VLKPVVFSTSKKKAQFNVLVKNGLAAFILYPRQKTYTMNENCMVFISAEIAFFIS